MNLVELDHALRKLRLSGMADVLEARLRQAQTEKLVPLDIVSALVATNCCAGRTGSSNAAPNWPASATPIAHWPASISTSTRR